MIFFKKKIIFIHVPRCGGTTIEKNLWKNEFNKKWDLIKNQGFDSTFKRMWEFYLSYCEAGFKSKNIDLIQFSLQNK